MTSAVIYQDCNLAYAKQCGTKIYNNKRVYDLPKIESPEGYQKF